jgi:hypothetical protein
VERSDFRIQKSPRNLFGRNSKGRLFVHLNLRNVGSISVLTKQSFVFFGRFGVLCT